MPYTVQDGQLVILLEGRITAANSAQLQGRIDEALRETGAEAIVLDAAGLEYIASSGLRVVLHVARGGARVSVVNASPETYEVFEMTGLSEVISVRRRLREVSVDGLQRIGAGANGVVYRLNGEQVLKVYNPLTNPPEKIEREKQTARSAFVLGIPSVISFDIVRVGDRYGIVYELIDALTLGETIARHPERADEYATRMASMLRQMHATEFEEGTLPDARLGLHAWVDVSEQSGYYSVEVIEKTRALIDSIPPRNTFVHGDFHPANVMVTDEDELLLIDMGDASMGDPIIDLLGSYQIMRLVAMRPGAAELYTGMSSELLSRVWHVFVRAYYGTDDDQEIARIEQRLRFHAVIRSMAGITFSSAVPDAERRATADQIASSFLHGWNAFEQGTR